VSNNVKSSSSNREPRRRAISSDEIAACRRGDRAALEAVFRHYAPALGRLLNHLTGHRADTEDLLQETFIQAIIAFPRFRGDAAVGTWLHRIAVRVAYRHLRRPQRRRTVSLELVGDGASPVDGAGRPDEIAQSREHLERLREHLEAIAPRKRIAFVLHVIEDRPLAEVAALMGATRAATKSRVFWARRELLARVRRDQSLRELAGGGRSEDDR
jgi:RNA polymerase sigma-70 factor (ECF subfamily)